MSASEEHIRFLLRRFADNEASETEVAEMIDLLKSPGGDPTLESFIMELRGEATDAGEHAVDWDSVWSNIQKKTQPAITRRLVWMRVAAAAVIVLLLSVGGYFYFNKATLRQAQGGVAQQKRFKNDVAPGGNKAILTLANGTKIILDSTANGTITQQGNTKIIKLDSGQLAYNTLNEKPGEILYNTVSTPRGGQYQILLSDGSKVWLNAASSLRYPTSFTGKERNVELTGEGYFEIAKNAAKPFHVKVNDMTVEVLGTHFNINAYNDEAAIKTTLLEGSVKVSSPSPLERAGVRLKPGEQAALTKDGEIKVVNADVDEAVAWKEGRFYFDGADIQTIMRQLSRWYDVEITYQSDVSDLFVAKISRDVPVSKLLQLLELTNLVHFKIEGNKITVMK